MTDDDSVFSFHDIICVTFLTDVIIFCCALRKSRKVKLLLLLLAFPVFHVAVFGFITGRNFCVVWKKINLNIIRTFAKIYPPKQMIFYKLGNNVISLPTKTNDLMLLKLCSATLFTSLNKYKHPSLLPENPPKTNDLI